MANEAVRDAFARQIRYCEAYGSPFTARLLLGMAQALAEGEPALRAVADWPGDPEADALPLRLAGALHALVLTGQAAELARFYPGGTAPADAAALRQSAVAALAAHPACLADYLARPPQTNEVGRSAVLLGGFQWIAEHTGLPLRLFELGASAGLNLQWDRYRYRYGEVCIGASDSPLELAPIWHGEPPPASLPRVVARAGCDLAPIDLTDEAQRLRLRSYVWADQEQRLRQLEAAMAIADRHPSMPERADAADWVERVLAEPMPDGAVNVIYHTIFWPYLPASAQARIETAIRRAGARATAAAPLAWLRFESEQPQQHPRLRLELWPGAQNLHLADAQAHGREIFWHGAATARTAPRHVRDGTSLTIP